MKRLRPDKFHSSIVHANQKNKKKTVNNWKYEVKRGTRLFLHVLGISPVYLTLAEVEQKLRIKQGNQRSNYIYEIQKKFAPNSQEFMYKLIMKLEDFVDENGHFKTKGSRKEGTERRLIRNMVESYGWKFDWMYVSKPDDEFYLKEVIDNIVEKKLVITITKKNDTINSMEVIVYNDITGKAKKERKCFVSIFLNNGKIKLQSPLIFDRQKGTVFAYSMTIVPNIHFHQYLDKIPIIANEQENSSNDYNDEFEIISVIDREEAKKIRYKYHLNLRGLLLYILLWEKSKKRLNEIEQVLQNLSKMDLYVDLVEEFIKFDPVFRGETISNNRIILEKKTPSNFKIKERFPFLSYYNDYSICLPRDFAVDTLCAIAKDFENKLEEIDIFDLKYEVTSIFFQKIEEYFWGERGFFSPRIESRRLVSDDIFYKLIDFQTEIRIYLKMRKEKELECFIKLTKYYEEANKDNIAARK